MSGIFLKKTRNASDIESTRNKFVVLRASSRARMFSAIFRAAQGSQTCFRRFATMNLAHVQCVRYGQNVRCGRLITSDLGHA